MAGSIYDEILDFANYAFNKAHAVSYAIVSYRTAYMKAHYPREYMAALITSVLDNSTKVAEYISECRELGIKLLPPDINESEADFTVVGDNLRFGMAAVKNVGRGFVRSLVTERRLGGKFEAFDEFCRRMYGQDMNRRAIESLIRAGAFDSLGYKRRALLQVMDTVIDGVASEGRKNIEGQFDLFGMSEDEGGVAAEPMRLPDVEEFSPQEKMNMEREMTGLYLTGHPMDEYREKAKTLGAVRIGAILEEHENGVTDGKYADGQYVSICGVVGSYKTRTTKNNSMMAYVTLEDDSGFMELICFQRALDSGGSYIKDNAALYVRGKISVRDEKEPQLMVDMIRPLTDLDAAPVEEPKKQKKLFLKLDSRDQKTLRRIDLILQMFEGKDTLVQYFADIKKQRSCSCLVHEAMVKEFKEILGEENVVLK